ncbi:MAG: PepSY domain-containing protein [Nitrosomonas sp.]|nr:PepSY domain-containing protein [Nitrosomonas sp.]
MKSETEIAADTASTVTATESNPFVRGFRHCMTWLHTWGGLWAGWVLFVIFLTGTLGVFDDPITRWMKPEQPPTAEVISTGTERAQVVRLAQTYLQQAMPRGEFWGIELPGEFDSAVGVFWQEDEESELQQARLDPITGKALDKTIGRETEGGHHFVHMHFEFHAGEAGIWLVGFFTMVMLAALISGVVIHKRIFKDFFTFRPKKGQRSWLDAHNVASVLTLPFQFMIVYTGLVIFYTLYMPAGIFAHYSSKEVYFSQLLSRPAPRAETHIDAQVVSLDQLLLTTETRLDRPASFVSVTHPGDSSASVRVFGLVDEAESEQYLLPPGGGSVIFDGISGAILDVQLPGEHRGGGAQAVQRVMGTLHMARFGGDTIRWLYFLCGLAGAVMIATGSILFMVKRRQKALNEFGAQTRRIYRLIETLNVTVIAGLCIACIAYLWGNRLIPVGIEDRSYWEIATFFAVWLAALLHASIRPVASAWVEQLSLAALLCLALPLLNGLTTGQQVWAYGLQGDWERAGVELTVIGLGLLFAIMANKARSIAPAAFPQKAAAPVPAAYRNGILMRVLAATLGGYAAASGLAMLLPLVLPMARAEAVLASTLLSFVAYTGVIIWVFSVQAPKRAWQGAFFLTAGCTLTLFVSTMPGGM